MNTLIDFMKELAVMFFVSWAVCTVLYMVYAKKLKKQYMRRVNELDLEAKGLVVKLGEKDRLIESLNKEVNRLNAKLKKDRLIKTLDDLEHERAVL